MVSISILNLWPWCCSRDLGKFDLLTSQLLTFKNGNSNSLLHKVVKYGISIWSYPAYLNKHPCPLTVFKMEQHRMILKTYLNFSGKREFHCKVNGCDKSFYTAQRLTVHQRTHTGEKPFVCQEKDCCKSFTTAGNLKNHMRIHTG